MPNPVKTTMNLRVLPSVKQRAKDAAKKAHQSLTAWLTTIIEANTPDTDEKRTRR